MKKYIVTFGSNHLKGFNVNPLKTYVVIQGVDEQSAREILFRGEIGNKFCTTYPYEMGMALAKKFKVGVITFKELGELRC